MKLVQATSEVLGLDLDTCLEAFGQHFLTFCQQNGYDKILRVLGSNLEDFLTNLDNLHDHLASTYPGMRAPSFRTTPGKEGTLLLHYFSERKGLHAIVRGLVKVVAKEFFHTEVTVETKEVIDKGNKGHVVFAIRQPQNGIHVPVNGPYCLASSSVGKRLTSDPRDLLIDVRSFSAAFPFHVMFGRDFVITQAGDSILRLTRTTWREKKRVTFGDLFRVCRPVIDQSFDAILDQHNMVFVVRTKDGVVLDCPSGLRLKGQMVWVPESESLLFLCSPRVSGLDEMSETRVFLSDFPVHDRGSDLVLLGHHRRGERELVEKLDEASNHLKVLDTKLREDKKRTEELLQSIFPGHVATKLCQSIPVEAERFDLVTCLFSDIVGFTAMCGIVIPIDIVRLLNRLYLQFDNLTSLHDVYKVETIGDAYMVVAGVPKFVPDHADRVLAMALAMVEVTRFVTSPVDGMMIEIRVGVHSGPVMAGVLGVKMPRYCLLGNTVSLANQLESRSQPGRVTISEDTKRCLTQDCYEFEENPKTSDLSVSGHFATRIPKEGDSGDMAALTVSGSVSGGGGGGSMFRSPTNSPGHSDEVTNDSNSPSLQSPSPHLTFKGNVCIPHIEVQEQVEPRNPRTGSPGFPKPEMGRIFVFPPSPSSSSCLTVKKTAGSPVRRPTIADDNLSADTRESSHSPHENVLTPVTLKPIADIVHSPKFPPRDPSRSIPHPSSPPSPRSSLHENRKGWRKYVLRNRKWPSHKLAPAERQKGNSCRAPNVSVVLAHSPRKVKKRKRPWMTFDRICSCGMKEILSRGPSDVGEASRERKKSLEDVDHPLGSKEEEVTREASSHHPLRSLTRRTTCGVIAKVKLTTFF